MLVTWCSSTVRNQPILVVGAFALAAVLGAPPAQASVVMKRLKPCSGVVVDVDRTRQPTNLTGATIGIVTTGIVTPGIRIVMITRP